MTTLYTALGLMSGTSADGIDAAILRTDGENHVEPLYNASYTYPAAFQSELKAAFGQETIPSDLEKKFTDLHCDFVNHITRDFGQPIDIIGFHGQTLFHAPEKKLTIQMGDGQRLADATSIDVIGQLRQADVAAGGQGAPLLPLYHRAIAHQMTLPAPLCVLNIGGVANVTWIGEDKDDILAFDTGPGNALVDDFIRSNKGANFDHNGALAAQGEPKQDLINQWLEDAYFDLKPPKSLDRNHWVITGLETLSLEDAAATLTAFTAQSIAKACNHFSAPPEVWLVCGGGRKNNTLMHMLKTALKTPVHPIDEYGFDGDGLEAQGFAYLAVRSLRELPLTLPMTTGAPSPQTGGILYKSKGNV